MRIPAILRPDSESLVGQVLPVGRQPLIARPVKLAADVPYAVFVLCVGERLRAHLRPVREGFFALAAGPVRLAGPTRMPVGQPVQALPQAFAGPSPQTVG